jgi:hypothetical protein
MFPRSLLQRPDYELGTPKISPESVMTGIRGRRAADHSTLGLLSRLSEVATGFSGGGFLLTLPTHARLSSDARCNIPRRFGIGRLIKTLGSVGMRCYSHLSDDEREQIGLLKALSHSIGSIVRAIRRPKSTVSREISRNRLPSGRYSPIHAADEGDTTTLGPTLEMAEKNLSAVGVAPTP